MKVVYLALLVLVPGIAYGHTVDSVGEYRVEIGWLNSPVVSGETNALEFLASPLEPGLELEEQVFKDGIEGLRKTVKIQLVYKNETITLPLSAVHNSPGRYYAAVNPTVSGFYQANILGTINDTPINLSMHPPKVAERAFVEFPEPSDLELEQYIDEQRALAEDIRNLQRSVDGLGAPLAGIEYAGIGAGIIGIGMAAVALTRSKKS
ncbi:MAG: hypothetical protein EB829_01525 [Nitrosopumilus sp. H8]|nr:MAG: hypothetical protein EB830_00800 [Nitrosopumilus sp. H13]RNJ79750.1 MAG: hypothetical protein EB829_01525 [Nitrosopumilus sp. H8]